MEIPESDFLKLVGSIVNNYRKKKKHNQHTVDPLYLTSQWENI